MSYKKSILVILVVLNAQSIYATFGSTEKTNVCLLIELTYINILLAFKKRVF